MQRLAQVFIWLAAACALGTILIDLGAWFDDARLSLALIVPGLIAVLLFWIFVFGFVILAPIWFTISVCLFLFRQRAKQMKNENRSEKTAA